LDLDSASQPEHAARQPALRGAGYNADNRWPQLTAERIFISYSRKEGAGFAADLREKLLAEGISVWQDIVALEGGRDWWSQIEDAAQIEGVATFRPRLGPIVRSLSMSVT
jgi:hypothetical protein